MRAFHETSNGIYTELTFIIEMKFYCCFSLMCKLRRITHKLNKAKGLYVKFVSDSPEFTYQ